MISVRVSASRLFSSTVAPKKCVSKLEGVMKKLIVTVCVFCSFVSQTLAFDSTPSIPESKQAFMQIEDIRPGMKGYGMTVFEGSTPEQFGVEVIGILKGVPNPKQASIIARLSGPKVDRTSVFAGMSGSPVYIDGKLVGAVAFTFPFSKEPLAGITPIKYMVENFERGAGTPAESGSTPQRVSFSTLLSSAANSTPPLIGDTRIDTSAITSSSVASYIGQTIAPIATPVSFSGIPQTVLDYFAGDLKKIGIQAIAGVSGGSNLSPMTGYNDDTLKPGSSVSVQLIRGDFTVDASGTVTYRDGERIYAFGHPFLGSGSTAWPMAESSVLTVVPNLNNSFKLSAAGNMVGSISQDRSTGVYGKLGQTPRMVPVSIRVRTSRDKIETYKFEIVSDSFLTPLLMRITTFAAVKATERELGSQTIKVKGNIAINGEQDVVLDNSFSAPNGALFLAVASIERPLAVLFNSGFDSLNLRGIDIEVSSTDSRSSGQLSRLSIDKTEVRRGERVEVQAVARNDNGAEFAERIPIEIPADAPLGQLVIVVGDGASVSQGELRVQAADFVPKDLGQLVRTMNKMKRNNRLYVKVLRSSVGAIVNSEEMPTLPPSVLATLGSQRTSGGYTPLSVATMSESELPPSKFVITGQQSITLNVVK